MGISSKNSICGMVLSAVMLAMPTQAQDYQNLGSYDDWAAQFGITVTPSPPPAYAPPVGVPLPTYRPPQVIHVDPPRYDGPDPYSGGGGTDTILYDRTGRIIGTRAPSGRLRYTTPPVPEPGNDDFDFQRDGRGRDGWRPERRHRGDVTGFDEDGNPVYTRPRMDRGFIDEPGNDDFDFQRDGRGRDDDRERTYIFDTNGNVIDLRRKPDPDSHREKRRDAPRILEPGFETEG
jgi:hypothetical protein